MRDDKQEPILYVNPLRPKPQAVVMTREYLYAKTEGWAVHQIVMPTKDSMSGKTARKRHCGFGGQSAQQATETAAGAC